MGIARTIMTTFAASVVLAFSASTAPAASTTTLPVKGLGDRLYVYGGVSGEGDGAALVVRDTDHEREVIAHQDRHGRWRTFSIRGNRLAPRVALLGGGAGIAAWAEGDRVMVRTWDAAGDVAAPKAVLWGVQTVWSGDDDDREWQMISDGRGTVAIASTSKQHGAILATVLDAGATGFSAPQVVQPGAPGAQPYGRDDQANLRFGPIGRGGEVTLMWLPGPVNALPSGDLRPDAAAQTFQATRPAAGRPFGAPSQPALFAISSVSEAAQRGAAVPASVQADASRLVRVGAGVLRLCARPRCGVPVRLAWDGAVRALAISREPTCFESDCVGSWWIAPRRRDGTFDRPVALASGDGGAALRTATPGVMAFAQVKSSKVVLKRVRVAKMEPVEGK